MSKLVKTSNYTGGNSLASSPISKFGREPTNRINLRKKYEDDKSNNNEIPQELQNYAIAVDRDLKNIIDYVNRIPKIYIQSAEPTIPSDTFSFWKDTDDSKFYLLVNIDGTQKKVEMT